MKKKLILAVMALGIGSISLAQGTAMQHSTHKPVRPVKPKFEQMRQDLDLTPEQFSSIRDIHMNYMAQRTEARKAGEQESTVVMRRLQRQERDEIHAVLTPEQQRKAIELRKRRNAQRLDAYDTNPKQPEK